MTMHNRSSKHEFDLCKDGKFFEAVTSDLTIYFGMVKQSCSLILFVCVYTSLPTISLSMSAFQLVYLQTYLAACLLCMAHSLSVC